MIGLKNSRHLLNQSDANQNQSRLGRTRFPALSAGYVYLLRVLIGSFCCFHLLRLAIMIGYVLAVLRHSIENRSNSLPLVTPMHYKEYVGQQKVNHFYARQSVNNL